MNNTDEQRNDQKSKDIAIRFPKGLVGDPFKSGDGKEFVKVSIPNQDPNDKTPWASFVVPSYRINQDKNNEKFAYTYLFSSARTTVSKPVLQGQDENGRNIWKDEKKLIPNTEIKKTFDKMYGRSSVKDKLKEKAEEAHQRSSDTSHDDRKKDFDIG